MVMKEERMEKCKECGRSFLHVYDCSIGESLAWAEEERQEEMGIGFDRPLYPELETELEREGY
jgi:hypothetical protein